MMEPSSLPPAVALPESTSSSSCLTLCHLFPSNYELVEFLGWSGFAEVLKCIKKDTKETVAVKVLRSSCNFNKELTLLNFLMWKNLDKCNIVRFVDSFSLGDNRPALAFEMLDITLKGYIYHHKNLAPLELHKVRSIVKQMATALEALRSAEVIHSDIKLDNIMLVDREKQPLKVKLIDFGLAFPTCRAKQGSVQQTTYYRAPEIILGLPFSEAIDMWSLGVVMAYMMFGVTLFPGNSEYDTLRFIMDILGEPAEHLLTPAMYLNYFFIRSSSSWRLKMPQEFWGKYIPPSNQRAYQFRNLDDVETKLNTVEAEESKECIDLLKAMLQIDPNKRITPQQVLNHLFIMRGTLQYSSEHTTEPGNSHADEIKETSNADW